MRDTPLDIRKKIKKKIIESEAWTMTSLAQRLGISKQLLHQWLQGSLKVDNFLRICLILGIEYTFNFKKKKKKKTIL